jgi:hemophore-related protein
MSLVGDRHGVRQHTLDEGASLVFTASTARRAVTGGLGAVAGAAFIGLLAAPLAAAQPAPPAPNCSAADFSGVASGVSAASSAYLFSHPDVNTFFTSLHGLPQPEVRQKVIDYFNQNPQYKADMTGIRQPLVDIKQRCGFTQSDPNGPNVP